MEDAPNTRTLIDGIALDLADVEESALTKELARRALAYVNRLCVEHQGLSEAELENVLQAAGSSAALGRNSVVGLTLPLRRCCASFRMARRDGLQLQSAETFSCRSADLTSSCNFASSLTEGY